MGAKLLALHLLLLALQLSASEPELEKPLEVSTCGRDSHPWQVSLFRNLQFRCAGVLVDRSWVLTAATCFDSWLWVRLGDYNLLLADGGEQLRLSRRLFRHPGFRPSPSPTLPRREHHHDLMLIKLRRPADLGARVRALPLPDACPEPGALCDAAGWATTLRPQVKYAKNLSCAPVKVLSHEECSQSYPGVVTQNMLCAGQAGGRDPCQGDSGGPLVCNGTLQGILSWGDYPCGSGSHPAVYTKICKYSSWINKVIRRN
ncbi:kallikrein-10-like [Tachyglossus aculeatus]|uniref:kallikrein-10-like n=1 Tax=Tachyglossus aculeatus TaxID=9261 RepID=UPI0018F65FA6|nr:kallikrein-10-like [Tachyglossus aculeatus]